MLLVYQPPLSIFGKDEKHICNKLKGGMEGSTGRREEALNGNGKALKSNGEELMSD